MTPTVSVIIPAFNVADTLGRCIESVLAQRLPRPPEIVVVDNGSLDGSREIAARYPVKLLDEPRRGRSAARNRGVRESSGELLAFIDADCEAAPDWLQASAAALDRPWLGAAQVRVQKPGFPPAPRRFTQASYYRPFLDTCALLTTRVAYDDARGFDEELRRNVDMDYSFRLLACGYAFAWLPHVTMTKHHDLSARQIFRRGWDGGTSVAVFGQKWRSLLPRSRSRIWLDRVKAGARVSLPDLRHPLRSRGRNIAEASLKLLASAVTELLEPAAQESRYAIKVAAGQLLGPARSLVVSEDGGLLYDAEARTVSTLSTAELDELRRRIDALGSISSAVP